MANPNKEDAMLANKDDEPFVSGAVARAANVADGSDAATTQTLANALKAILVDHGFMTQD